jgi:hypothetical protein
MILSENPPSIRIKFAAAFRRRKRFGPGNFCPLIGTSALGGTPPSL